MVRCAFGDAKHIFIFWMLVLVDAVDLFADNVDAHRPESKPEASPSRYSFLHAAGVRWG